MSDEGKGPKCYYCNDKYRIEEFVDSRALTLFELRNPTILKMLGTYYGGFAFN